MFFFKKQLTMARPANKLPPGAPLPVSSNWCHSICDVVKVDHEWTIHQFQLRDDVEHSTEFPVGKRSKDSEGMMWKLSVNDRGIHISQSVCCPGQPMTFTGNCTKSFRVTCGIVDASRKKVNLKKCLVRKGVKMPVNAVALEALTRGILENGNLNVFCEIESYKDEQELVGSSVNVVVPKSSSSEELVKHFEELFESKKFSDVTFNVRGQKLAAHKAILSARSPVFAAMFQHPTKETLTGSVDVHDIEPEVFKIMLRFIYTGQVVSKQMEEVATELLATADKYFLENLKHECENHLVQQMSPENCFKLLSLDCNNPAYYLKEKALDFLRKNPSKVMSLDSWKKSSKENPVWIVSIKEMLLETLAFEDKTEFNPPSKSVEKAIPKFKNYGI